MSVLCVSCRCYLFCVREKIRPVDVINCLYIYIYIYKSYGLYDIDRQVFVLFFV